MALFAVAALLAACTGGSGHPQPVSPSAPVLPSADRIRLGQTRLGGPAECLDDEYCAAGLTRVYGVDLGDRIVGISTPAATVGALDAGAIDIGVLPAAAVERADRRIAVLTDDRELAPANGEVAIASDGLAQAGGAQLAAAVDEISQTLAPADFVTMEQAVAGGASPELAAQGWLQAHPLTPTAAPPAVLVTLGATTDPTNEAVVAAYAGDLRRLGWAVDVVQLEGGRSDALDALSAGKITMTIDGAASMLERLTGFTGAASADVATTLARLRTRLAELGLVAYASSTASSGYVYAVSRAVASALGLTTLSDLARASGAHPPPSDTDGAAAAGTAGPVPATMGTGSAGAAVVSLQTRLADLGYLSGLPTGVFDEATRRAVVAYQGDHGLITDGEADVPTQRSLLSARPGPRPGAAPLPGDFGSLRVPAAGLPGSPAGGGPLGTIYLAFAGGPSPVTGQILDLLHQHSATATFFADDDQIGTLAETLRAAADAGNGIGTALDPHQATSPIASDVLFRTVTRTQDDLAEVVHHNPTCLLMPYGALDQGTVGRASQLGLRPVLWDVDPQDWRRPGTDAIVTDVIENARAGSIVLLHDGGGDRNQTVVAVSEILGQLGARGYGFGVIPDCQVGPGSTSG